MQQTAKKKTYRNVRAKVWAVYKSGVVIRDGWNEMRIVPWEHIKPNQILFAGFRGEVAIEKHYADGEGLFA